MTSPVASPSALLRNATAAAPPAGDIPMAICPARDVGPGCVAVGFSLPPALKFPSRPSSCPAPPSLVPLSIVGELPGIGGPVVDEWLPPPPLDVVMPGELRR